MKINMSEELHFDELEINDGSEAKEDAEKEAEKAEKETQKEIDKRIDDVEDINTAEPKDLKLKMDKSNSKIKELKEGKLTLDEDDDLDEAIPKDLAKAYKRSRYQGDYNADLQNANYNEVSPDEAYNIIKKQDKERDVRIIINGKLIKINNGYGERDDRFRTDVPIDKAYVRKSGAKERDTARMGLKHLLGIADKIYVTNEAEPEGQKDQDVINARRLNPESKFYGGSNRIGDGRGSRNYSGWYSDKEIKNKMDRIYDEYRSRKNELASKLASGDLTQDEYNQAMKVAKNDLASRLRNDYGADAFYDKKDYAARKRYRSAEDAITAPIKRYNELKDEIDSAQYSVDEYTKKIDKIKNNGSYKTRDARSSISYYKRQLDSIAAKLAELEMVLETADETDQAEISKAQAELDQYTAKLDSYKDEVKKLLRKTEGLEELYDKIDDSKELKEDFEDILDSLYPEGYSADKIVEALKDKEMISEMLDME